MMQKKAFLVLALVGMASASGLAGQRRAVDDDWCRQERNNNNDREQACEVREFTVPVGAAQLSLDAAPNGGIEVKGATRGDIVVQAKVTTYAATQARARELISSIRVDAASDKVSADGPRTDRRESWSVSYRLAVPSQMSLDLRTVNGGIAIENVDGRLEFTTVNGGVKSDRCFGLGSRPDQQWWRGRRSRGRNLARGRARRRDQQRRHQAARAGTILGTARSRHRERRDQRGPADHLAGPD